jgi:hypothetical protein
MIGSFLDVWVNVAVTFDPDQIDSTKPQSDVWVCPYCDASYANKGGLKKHATNKANFGC